MNAESPNLSVAGISKHLWSKETQACLGLGWIHNEDLEPQMAAHSPLHRSLLLLNDSTRVKSAAKYTDKSTSNGITVLFNIADAKWSFARVTKMNKWVALTNGRRKKENPPWVTCHEIMMAPALHRGTKAREFLLPPASQPSPLGLRCWALGPTHFYPLPGPPGSPESLDKASRVFPKGLLPIYSEICNQSWVSLSKH